MYKVNINKATLQNHFQYDWWQYFIAIAATIFIWTMIVAMTRPQTPAELKVDIFLVGGFAFEEGLDAMSADILEDFPNLQEINFTNIVIDGNPQLEVAGRQKLMVMLGSQTGDIFVFNQEEFEVLATQGAFLPLDGAVDDLIQDLIPQEELDRHLFASEEAEGVYSEPRVFGLPLKGSIAFEESFFDVENKVIAVMAYSRNSQNALNVMRWILEKQ